MYGKSTALTALIAGSFGLASSAYAQQYDRDDLDTGEGDRLEPVREAVELKVNTGYMQGFGDIGAGQASLDDLTDAGGAVEIGVGYRMRPEFLLGLYGTFAMYDRGLVLDESADVFASTAGVEAGWHFAPAHSDADPWIALASGWRGLWIDENAGTTSLHGWQIGRLQVGVDFRVDRNVALSPLVGADVSMFFSSSPATSGSFANIESPEAHMFIFAGVQGRFDVPTDRGSSVTTIASR